MSYQVSPNIPAQVAQYALIGEVDPILVAAVVLQESAGNPDAIRPEPAFYWKYLHGKQPTELPGYWPNPSFIPPAFEFTWRSTSWGLMQVMGETAREAGYKDPFLTHLLQPSVNLSLGIKILAKLLRSHDQDVKKALLRWNGGGNHKYPGEVLIRISNGEASRYLSCSHHSGSGS